MKYHVSFSSCLIPLLAGFFLVCTHSMATASSLFAHVPEARNYAIVYELDIPNTAAWNANPIPYSIDESGNIDDGSFPRVAYYLELESAGATNWVYVSMDTFTADASLLGVPKTGSGGFFHFGNIGSVTNANIFSNMGGVTTGTGINTINLEFWSSNYGGGNQHGVPGANGGTFDFGDGGGGTGTGYGSMQIHNYGPGETLFAYNRWGGGVGELGIGNQPTGNPDWTFSNNVNAYTKRTLQVLVFVGGVNWSDPVVSGLTTSSADVTSDLAVTDASDAVAWLYWDTVDRGETTTGWAFMNSLGTVSTGLVTSAMTSLLPDTTYHYRFYGTNSVTTNHGWSAAASLTALTPGEWSGNQDDRWGNANNWAGGAIPDTAGETALFRGNGPGEVDLDGVDYTIGALSIHGGDYRLVNNNAGPGSLTASSLLHASGANTIDTAMSITGAAEVSGGDLTLLDLASFTVPGLTLSGGTLGLEGDANALSVMPGAADKLIHSGYHGQNNDSNMNLDNNGGLMNLVPFGTTVLTTGPADRGLDFNVDQDFINTGAIGQVDQYANLFIGYFIPPSTGTYGFRNAGDDDRAGIWLDLNRNGIFESSISGMGSNRGEQLSWEDGGNKQVSLTAGLLYRIAFTHREGGGGSRCDFRFTTPSVAERIIKPADPVQAGLWAAAVMGSDVTQAGLDVDVRADSHLRGNAINATLGSLTISNNVTLTTSGNQAAINFSDTTIPAGATGVGFHADTDISLTDSAGLEGSLANVVITKTGRGDLMLDREGSNLGNAVFDVQAGGLAAVHAGAFDSAALQLSGGELKLSSPGGDITYVQALPVTADSGLLAARVGSGMSGPLDLTLSGNITFTGDHTLTVRSGDDYNLLLPGEIVGNGMLNIMGGQVSLSDTNFNAVTLFGGTLALTNRLEVNALVQNGGAIVQAGVNKDLTVHDTLTLTRDLDMSSANLDVSTATVTINTGAVLTDDVPLVVDILDVKSNGQLNVPGSVTITTRLNLEPTTTISNILAGTADVVLGDSELFTGFVSLTGTNSYTGETLIKRAVLRADEGVGLPAGSLLRFQQNNRDQLSIFGTHGTFERNIGTQPGEVFWENVGGGGGFAAEGGDLIVSLETNAPLTWADADLGFNNTDSLQFGSAEADGMVELTNAIDLGNTHRRIQIRDNNGRKTDFVRLSGILSGTPANPNIRLRLNESVGNNFIEGLLELTGSNSFGQSLTIDEGVVYALEGVGLPAGSALRFDQGVNVREGAFMSNGTLNREIGVGAGEVRWDNHGGFAARGGTFVVTLESGGPLTWDNIDTGFGAANRRLLMGSRHADSIVELVNDIVLPADGQIMVYDNADTDADVCKLSGVLSGTGRLRKVGGNDHRGGTLWLTGANTYNGLTFLDEGAVRAIDGVGLPAGSELYFEADSAARPCAFESSGAFTRNIGNTAGEVYWQGSGGFAAWGGLLNVNLEGGAALLWGNADTGFRGQQLLLGSRTANDIVTIENPVTLDGTRVVRSFDNPHSDADYAVMSGDLRQDASNRQLQKFGDGRLDLTSLNNYIWTLRAYEGVLNINGRNEGNYTQVHNGGTLGGNGELVLLDDLQVDAGGTLAPGTGVGTLTVTVDTGGDELRMLNGSTYAWEIGSDNVGDRIDVFGNLRLDNTWTLSLRGGGGTPVASAEYTLFTYTENFLSSTTIDLVTSVVIDGREAPVDWDSSGAVVKHDATGKRVYLTGLSSTLGLVNTAASDLMPTSATLNGLVSGTGETFSVTVYWGTSDQGTDAGSWDERMPLGQAIDPLAQPVFHPLAGLETNTLYYYTFRATNATTDLWATPSEPFTTLGPPRVDNGDGATNIKVGSARLQGGFLDHNRGNVTIVWGRSDAGTGSIGAWEHAEDIGPQAVPTFSTDIEGLLYPLTYVYRTYAVNPYGESWSDPATNFTMNVNPKDLEVPVTEGLLAWFDAGSGVTTNASGVVQTWEDRSGNEHHATLQGGNPTLVPQAINTWPEVQTRGRNSYFDVAGNMFVKEQYVVGRSAGATWNNY
jgi:hypothetical protein